MGHSMIDLQIMSIATLIMCACIIPGTFLVLRGASLMSDAVSHASLLGIVLVFFVTKNLSSIWLIVGASIFGLLTVFITENLIATKRLKSDAAIGLVFPIFFSLGVILINKYTGHIHFDPDCVLFGELAYAPFDRLVINDIDLGPQSLWVMGVIFSINLFFLFSFYKELKLSTFDPLCAKSLGFNPRSLYYLLMSITSITAVAAFESVGSILVVAFMIIPSATAFLCANQLSRMLFISFVFGFLAVLFGLVSASTFNISISGAIVTASLILFLIVLFLGPKYGFVFKLVQFYSQKIAFSCRLLLVQLVDHEGSVNEKQENSIQNMVHHMQWSHAFAKKVTQYGVQKQMIIRKGDHLYLTNLGRELARQSLQTN